MPSAWDDTPLVAVPVKPPVSAWDATPDNVPPPKAPPSNFQRASNFAAGFNYGAIPGTLGLPVDTALNVWDLAKAAAGRAYGAATGNAPPAAFDPSDRRNYVGSSQWIADQIRKLPAGTNLIDNQNPDDQASRLLYSGGSAAGGAVTSSRLPAPGGTAPVPASNIQLAKQLTRDVGGTVGGAAASGAAAQAAYEKTGDPSSAVLASFAPVIAQKTLAATTRGVMRGGEEGRQQMQDNIDAADQAGTTLSVGQASQKATPQLIEALLSKIPGGYGVFKAKGEQQQRDLKATIDYLTADGKNEPDVSGRIIQQGIKSGDADNPGFYERFKAKQGQLYGALDQLVPPDTPVPVNNTRDQLYQLTEGIDGAPNVGQRFINSKIADLRNDLDLDTGMVRPSGTRTATVSFGPQDPTAPPITRTAQVSWGSPKWVPRAGGEGAAKPPPYAPSGTVTRSIQIGRDAPYQPSGDVTRVTSIAGPTPGEGTWKPPEVPALPYEAVKKLRTYVGNEMSDNTLMSSVPQSQWKRLYGGLTEDLQGFTQSSTPDVQRAWDRATAFTRGGMDRLQALNPYVNAATPERAFEMLVNSANHGPTQINSVKRSLTPDQWKQVVSNVVSDLGNAKPGQQNNAGDAFSAETFLTNWNRMDPKAKTALVSGFDGADQMRSTLDAMAQTTANSRASAKVLANPSGTAPALNATHMMYGSMLASGVTPWALLAAPATMGGAYGGSKIMTSPGVASWLAKPTAVKPTDQRSYAGRLATLLLSSPEESR